MVITTIIWTTVKFFRPLTYFFWVESLRPDWVLHSCGEMTRRIVEAVGALRLHRDFTLCRPAALRVTFGKNEITGDRQDCLRLHCGVHRAVDQFPFTKCVRV